MAHQQQTGLNFIIILVCGVISEDAVTDVYIFFKAHLELNLRNKSFQQEIENLKKERQELFGVRM